MVIAIAIENFKAIRERVSFELKPITLLFGPNSAGKSTILHALHYAREVFERHNLDADRTLSGGDLVDLGGFRNFVHGRDKSLPVVLRFDLDLDSGDVELGHYPAIYPDFVLADYGLPRLGEAVETVAVEVEIAWSELRETPYVRRYQVWINGTPLAVLRAEFERRQVRLTDLNVDHAVFRGQDGDSVLALATEPYDGNVGELVSIPVEGLDDALPRWGNALQLVLKPRGTWEVDESTDSISYAPVAPGTGMMIGLLSHLIVGPGEWVRDVLSRYEHLGPLREPLARNYTPPRFPDPARWANGLAAWDQLYTDESLVREVSRWLSDSDRLDTGYGLQFKQYKELPLDSALMVLLRSERAFDDLDTLREEIDKLPTRQALTLLDQQSGMEVQPHDVGVGLSQLIPVVTLALSGPGFAAVEQPELHLHPAIQVRLGELFIHVATRPEWFWHRFLIETHSEHLLLRLLRRIRETYEDEVPAGRPRLEPRYLSVVYVETHPEVPAATERPSALRVHQLRIDETGEFMDRWPRGFFEERAEELF